MPLLGASFSVQAAAGYLPVVCKWKTAPSPSAGSQPYNVPSDPQPLVQLAELQMRKLRLGELRALVLGDIPAIKNPRQPHDLLRMRGLCNLQKTSTSSPT